MIETSRLASSASSSAGSPMHPQPTPALGENDDYTEVQGDETGREVADAMQLELGRRDIVTAQIERDQQQRHCEEHLHQPVEALADEHDDGAGDPQPQPRLRLQERVAPGRDAREVRVDHHVEQVAAEMPE